MADYKIVKYCMRCKKRFIVARGESSVRFCQECQQQVDEEIDNETEELE